VLVRPRLPALTALLLVASCSVLIPWEDRPAPVDPAEKDSAVETGTIVGELDAGSTPATPRDGAPLDDAAAPEDANVPDTRPLGPCEGLNEGEPARSGNNQRCCGGVPTSVSSKSHCGGCGVACNPAHDCQFLSGYWACAGCAVDGGGSHGSCWTGCCSQSLSAAGACEPRFVCGVPTCNDDICAGKSPGLTCHQIGIFATACGY